MFEDLIMLTLYKCSVHLLKHYAIVKLNIYIHKITTVNQHIMCLYVLSSVLLCPLRFPNKNNVRFVFPPVVCRRTHVLFTFYVLVCAYCCSTHIVLCFLRLMYPMLPVTLDCPFLLAPATSSNFYLALIQHFSYEHT